MIADMRAGDITPSKDELIFTIENMDELYGNTLAHRREFGRQLK